MTIRSVVACLGVASLVLVGCTDGEGDDAGSPQATPIASSAPSPSDAASPADAASQDAADVPALAAAPPGDASLWLSTIGVPVVGAIRTSTPLARLGEVAAADRVATCRQVAADLDGIAAPQLLTALAITADAETATLLVADLQAKADLLAACEAGGEPLDALVTEVARTHEVAVAWLGVLGEGAGESRPEVPAPSTEAADAEREALVLGDSYASGEGLPSASGACGTEPERSWGALVAEDLGFSLRLLACSGAEVADLTVGGPLGRDPQLAVAAEQGPAELVLLTVGGNDLGFTDIVADCLGLAELQSSPATVEGAGWAELVSTGEVDRGCDVTTDELLERVAALRADDRFQLAGDGTTGGLAQLYAQVAEQTVADGGRLLVVGYPALFEEPDRWVERYGRRCHGVLAEDVAGLNQVVRELDAVIAEEVTAARELTDREVLHVGLVEPYDDGEDDHRLCGAGRAWMNGLTVSEGGIDVAQLLARLGQGGGPGGLDLQELGARPSGSFHPGTAGHRGTAEVVGRAAAAG